MVKESACSARDAGLIPGSGRSSGGGHSYPFQYYYLENSMDRRGWWVTAHRVAKSWVTERLSSRSSWEMEVHRVTTLLLFSCSVMSDSSDPVDCSSPGSPVHGILQVRILEWVAISFSRGSFQPGDRTQVSHIVGRCFYCLSHQGSPRI